jgi:alkylation response protein AidB-like acyl-CoA dehydrogenase
MQSSFFIRPHWLCKNHRSFSKEKAVAKVFCSKIHRVVNQAVQIHGVYGLMKEYPIERHYWNLRILDIVEGTSEIQRIVISRLTGDGLVKSVTPAKAGIQKGLITLDSVSSTE